MKTILRRRMGLVVLVVALLPVMGGCPSLEDIVIFPDPALNAAVRAQLGIPLGFLTKTDVLALTTLDAQGQTQVGGHGWGTIYTLQGIEACTNLTTLNVSYNHVSDLTPLAELTNLRALYLHKNPIHDISALNGLVNLDILTLWGDAIQIYDYSPLSALAGAQTQIEGDNINFNINLSGEDVYKYDYCNCGDSCTGALRDDVVEIYIDIMLRGGTIQIHCLQDGTIDV